VKYLADKKRGEAMDNMSDVTNKRLTGITILVIMLVLQGGLELLGIATAFVAFKGVLATGIGIANLSLVVATFVLVWGLWTLKPWAFWATVIIESLSLILRLFTIFQPNANVSSILLRMILPILILIYLFANRNIRAAFRT
jgi:uncharacterized membrane protein (DUF2068 family)